jgi:hypothetical protein
MLFQTFPSRDDFGMLRSAKKLFARKLDPSIDDAVLNMIDNHLLHVGGYAAARDALNHRVVPGVDLESVEL